MKTPVFILFGPTASGKTALLERLFASGETERVGKYARRAETIPAEIISADSMQVYRGMDIGTAKPSLAERAKIPHHLIDIRNPDEQFNAGEFVRLAEEACLAANGRGALPVVSGGTGFYLVNLVLGLAEAPPSDAGIRLKLKEDLERLGAASLMEELAAADPVSAGRIHINDEYRLLRALEVYRLTGRPLSSFASPWTKKVIDGKFRFLIIGLRRSREELYRRIDERAAAMMRAGLYDEVKRLYEAGYTPADPGLKAIGYREFFVENLDAAGDSSESSGGGNTAWRLSHDLAGVEALIARNSRRYAKRQTTFFASLPGAQWVDSAEDAVPEIRRALDDFLRGG